MFKCGDGSGGGGEEGVGAGGVVGDIDEAGDLREFFGEDADDAVVQRLIGHGASLTAARHLDVGDVFFELDELDVAAMLGQSGVDGFVEDL